MSWTEYVVALRDIPEDERRAEIARCRAALQFKDSFSSDRRQRALARERLTVKIRAIEESLT